MSIAATIQRFLGHYQIPYEVVAHPYRGSSYGSALAARVAPDRVAKGVVLKEDSTYTLAVLPATRRLDINRLRRQTEREYELASEDELRELLPDCTIGAVPAVGPAYGMNTLVEQSLRTQPELYFEAGDHEELIRVSESDFEKLLGDATYLEFSELGETACKQRS